MNNDSNYIEWLEWVQSTASDTAERRRWSTASGWARELCQSHGKLVQAWDKLVEENKILSQNVYDLQKQLQEAHKRIKELIDRSIVSM